MSNDYEITKLEIAKLELKEGDILVVRILHRDPSKTDIDHIGKILGSILLAGVKSIIFNHNHIELSIISGPSARPGWMGNINPIGADPDVP
jgi:hypothetical protein